MDILMLILAISIFGVLFESICFILNVKCLYETKPEDAKEYQHNTDLCEKTLFKFYGFAVMGFITACIMFLIK